MCLSNDFDVSIISNNLQLRSNSSITFNDDLWFHFLASSLSKITNTICSIQICLFCRQHGHSLKNCPEKSDTNKKKLCYNCGEVGHSLSKCPLPLEDGMHWSFICIVLVPQNSRKELENFMHALSSSIVQINYMEFTLVAVFNKKISKKDNDNH